MKPKHRALPWKTGSDGLIAQDCENPYNDLLGSDPKHLANAEFIVKACNNFYELLEALKSATEALQGFGTEDLDYYNSIINKAEGR